MIDLPPNLPEPTPVSETLLYECARYASKHYDVSPFIVMSIISVEGGKKGTVSKNSNGTYDLGVMQINTIHLPEIKSNFPMVDWQVVTNEPCVNIGIGTWMLSKRIKEADNLWQGVGNYHSRTPKYHRIYLNKIYRAYKKVLSKYLSSSIKNKIEN